MVDYVRCKHYGHSARAEDKSSVAAKKLRSARKALIAARRNGEGIEVTDKIKNLAISHWLLLLSDYDQAYEHEFNFLFSSESELTDILEEVSNELECDQVKIDFDVIDANTVRFHVDTDEEASEYIKEIVEILKKKYTGIIEFDNYGRGSKDNFVILSTFNNDEIAKDLESLGLRSIEFQVEGKPDGTRYSNMACHAEFLVHFDFKNFNAEAEERNY